MNTLIQDYKNWKQACAELRQAEVELNEYFYSIVRYVSRAECIKNRELSQKFINSLPKDRTQPDYKDDFIAAYKFGIKEYRAPYCFFTARLGFLNKLLLDSGYLSLDSIFIDKCINNHVTQPICKERCEGCPCFEKFEKYVSLYVKVEKAKQQREGVKKQLVSHFCK